MILEKFQIKKNKMNKREKYSSNLIKILKIMLNKKKQNAELLTA